MGPLRNNRRQETNVVELLAVRIALEAGYSVHVEDDPTTKDHLIT